MIKSFDIGLESTKQRHPAVTIKQVHIPVVVISLGHVLRLLGNGGLAPSE